MKTLIDEIIEGAGDLEDGETGTDKCIDLYCEEKGIDDATAAKAKQAAFRKGALDAGVPLSVIEGRSKLSDHFSTERIAKEINRK